MHNREVSLPHVAGTARRCVVATEIPISQLTLDGIPTPFERCVLELDDDSWSVTVVGMYEAYGVPNKKGHEVPVSFDTPSGRRAGVALVASVEHEDHTEERMIVRLEGAHPLG
jgi:hypothetical protein